MNPDLHTIIDRLTFAPAETKAEILSILFSEDCVKTKGITSTLAHLFIKAVRIILGRKKVKALLKRDFLSNSAHTERMFLHILEIIVKKEQLTLIQDLLCAVHLSGWVYDPNDVQRFLDRAYIIPYEPK